MGDALVFLLQAGGTGWLTRPLLPSPSRSGPVAHPTHGGPSRYEMKVLGYNLMQAMRFAVEEINNDSSLLPDVLKKVLCRQLWPSAIERVQVPSGRGAQLGTPWGGPAAWGAPWGAPGRQQERWSVQCY